jgi:hypothetical protein
MSIRKQAAAVCFESVAECVPRTKLTSAFDQKRTLGPN